LCLCAEISPYFADKRRRYLVCGTCGLVFVPPQYLLDRDAERAEYDLHQNVVSDPGYRAFLRRLAEPLMQRLEPGASGLDFGCGPGPALAQMLREAGFSMTLYDSFYQRDERALQARYDFICATEVVEHLHRPGAELQRLWSLLRPGGWLGVMTKLVLDKAAFAGWHYKNDPTHVCFFSEGTWRWWAQHCGASLTLIGADVILLRRE
jgi:SAM-dependent methyltransferase